MKGKGGVEGGRKEREREEGVARREEFVPRTCGG